MLEPWADKIMYYITHATVIILAVILIAIIIILIVGFIELIKSILKGMKNETKN